MEKGALCAKKEKKCMVCSWLKVVKIANPEYMKCINEVYRLCYLSMKCVEIQERTFINDCVCMDYYETYKRHGIIQ